MSASASRKPVVKKKQVRFARMTDEDENDDQEDTLFDKRKDIRRGLKSVLKAGKRRKNQGFDGVEIIDGAGSDGSLGNCRRWMVTLALCTSFLGLGMSISVVGPTFEDLAINVNQDISNISYIFVGRASGYIGGSLFGGILFDHLNPHLMLGFSMLVTALGMCAIPFCKKAAILTIMMSGIGATMGILDTGGNVLILNTWRKQAGPHMQALHFSFAVGAFASPIIAKLIFGTDLVPHKNVSAVAMVTSPPVTDLVSEASLSTALLSVIQSWTVTLRSMWAYVVIGSFLFLVSLLFFFIYTCCSPSRDTLQTQAAKPQVSKSHNALIIMLFWFFFWYVGAEVAYGSFIFTFAKDYAHMEQSQAAGLNSLFWGMFATGRGLAIFFATCMHPGTMILLSLLGCMLSSLLLTFFNNVQLVLWICTGLYGFSMSTTFPSGISWVEQYTTVTGRSAAVFVVGAALGEMVLPALLGFLLGRITGDHPLLMYLVLLTSTITSILFPVMYKLATTPSGPSRRPNVRGRPEPDDGEDRQALLDSRADEEEEQEDEADQWNDADFEVIEMDDAGLLNSPKKPFSSPPDVAAGLSGDTSPLFPSALSKTQSPQHSDRSSFSDHLPLLGESPRRKLLLSLEREKRD
ncbi:sodium-dependent glucose transporter 1 [Osmerus mordax]|uniref:sodium-dependent glucose transporter 1 n=1 Tax=Osmerus mordax TaxID=8014 RepID=UPI00350F772B